MPELRPRFTLPTRRSLRLRPQRAATPAPEVSMEARPEDVVSPVEQSMVDAAIYRNGHRIESPSTVAEAARLLREQDDTIAWIGLLRPTEAQLVPMATEFGLHELAVEDAIVAHQRPARALRRHCSSCCEPQPTSTRRRRSNSARFTFLSVAGSCSPVRHSRTPDLSVVRRRMEEDPSSSRVARSILYAILDSVVDGYAPVIGASRRHRGDQKSRSSAATQMSRAGSTSCRQRGRRVPAFDAAAGRSPPTPRRRLPEIRHGRGAPALSP